MFGFGFRLTAPLPSWPASPFPSSARLRADRRLRIVGFDRTAFVRSASARACRERAVKKAPPYL
eukprot:scaffold33389_cov91-Cyclotella_meneghiniana.AAC.3